LGLQKVSVDNSELAKSLKQGGGGCAIQSFRVEPVNDSAEAGHANGQGSRFLDNFVVHGVWILGVVKFVSGQIQSGLAAFTVIRSALLGPEDRSVRSSKTAWGRQ
jgi:hypothetical protein